LRHTCRSRNFWTRSRRRGHKPVRRGLSSICNNCFLFRWWWGFSLVRLK
jgi:hypothetical protein